MRTTPMIALLFLVGCNQEVQRNTVPVSTAPVEQDLKITYGGFLSGGDEHQKVEGTCTADKIRTALSCDIYNGLPNWQLTELVIRVTWAPYNEDQVRDFQERVSIPSLKTVPVSFRLGTQLPADTFLGGHQMSHWSWIVAGAKGITRP